MIENRSYQKVKSAVESYLKKMPDCQDADLFEWCGVSNLHLGYLIIAEQMFTKLLAFPDKECIALKLLGDLAKKQDNPERAIECYRASLEIDQTQFKLSFEMGSLLLQLKNPTDALDFLTYAINQAVAEAINTEPHELANMYLTRMRCYQAMDLVEHAQNDYVKVLEADPNFIQRTLLEKKQRGEAQEQWIF